MSRVSSVHVAWDRRSPRRAGVRSLHPRRNGASLGAAAALLVLAACGAPTEAPADIAVLADRAERLAEHLEAGDGCLAEREGQDLVARARDAVATDRVPAGVDEEVRDVVAEVTAAVPCDDGEAGDDGDGATTEEEPEEEEEEREEAERAREGAEGPEEGNSGRGKSDEGPPGRSEDGPPGQRGSGRGRG